MAKTMEVKNSKDFNSSVTLPCAGKSALTRKIVKNAFFCKFHISPSISILCHKITAEKSCKVFYVIKLCTSLTYAELYVV